MTLHGVRIVSLFMDGKERLCLAQISNTLLKDYSYNEIHNRRVALGITCVQCTPVQVGSKIIGKSTKLSHFFHSFCKLRYIYIFFCKIETFGLLSITLTYFNFSTIFPLFFQSWKFYGGREQCRFLLGDAE